MRQSQPPCQAERPPGPGKGLATLRQPGAAARQGWEGQQPSGPGPGLGYPFHADSEQSLAVHSDPGLPEFQPRRQAGPEQRAD